MFTQERFERWLRGLDPQLPNPFLVQPRVEGLDERLAEVNAATALIATAAANAATLVLQTAVAAATTLAQNAAALAASLAASLALKVNLSDFQVANASYRTILEASGSHTEGITPDIFSLGNGNPVVASGSGAAYPTQTISIQSADYPTINAVTPKLRLRVQLSTNSTDPNCKYFFRLYPVDSVAGGPGAVSFTLGSPIMESETGISGPSPDTLTDLVGSDFELPADGVYAIGVEITHNMQPNSHVVFSAKLQIHNA